MRADWKVLSLKGAGVRLIDCDHRTPPAAEAGYPYVAIPQIKNGRIDLSDARQIIREHFLEWTRKALPQAFDVVLSRRCNPGETAWVPSGAEFALGQNLVLLRAEGPIVYPPFLRWLVRGREWWEQVGKFINVGAVFDSLKCADIPNFKLTIPPLEEQRAIAHVLSTLDDKIELNRRMNETLEALAQALFDYFFPYSPVDKLPNGWRIGRLDELLVLQRGFDLPASRRIPGSYPVVAASGPSGTHNHFMVRGPGVTTGRSGILGNVYFVHEDFWPLNTSLWIREYRHSTPAYAFHLLRRLDFGLFDAGSAVPTLNRNHVHNLLVATPPMDTIQTFDSAATPLLKRQKANDEESVTLAALRDALMPKLLSGGVRIREHL
jgi:type I restriction enzyme S subunit